MHSSFCVAVSAAAAAAVITGSAAAIGGGSATIQFSSDTSAGTVNPFPWDGGNAGGFGTAGTLDAAMRYAANMGGGTNFGGAGFLPNDVNLFIVDFTNDPSGTFNDAGLTAFMMWGNGAAVNPFLGEAQVAPVVSEGIDGTFTSGLSEIYALGAGVTIDTGGIAIDVNVVNDTTPIGYAITNLLDYPTFRVNQQWSLDGSIKDMGLYGFGEGRVWVGVDDDGGDNIFTDGLVIIVPAPPVAMALLGFAVAGRPRRRSR